MELLDYFFTIKTCSQLTREEKDSIVKIYTNFTKRRKEDFNFNNHYETRRNNAIKNLDSHSYFVLCHNNANNEPVNCIFF